MRGARRWALLVVVGAVAGCGSPDSGAGHQGAHVFARDCAMCHSLIGNESRHRQGGDLLGYRMTRRELREFTREMPVRHRLTAAELNAVVEYVFALQQRGPSR
jgi:mono/diheme cytochrome c family protein